MRIETNFIKSLRHIQIQNKPKKKTLLSFIRNQNSSHCLTPTENWTFGWSTFYSSTNQVIKLYKKKKMIEPTKATERIKLN